MKGALPSLPDQRAARQVLVSALALARAAMRALAAPELTVPEALVLWWLTRYPGCTAGQLSLDLGMEPSGVSVAVHRLERRRWLARIPDPRDRRRAFLRATAGGRAAAAAALGALEGRLESAAARLGPAQLESADRVLSALAAALTPAGRPRAASPPAGPAPGPSRSAPAGSPARRRTRRAR